MTKTASGSRLGRLPAGTADRFSGTAAPGTGRGPEGRGARGDGAADGAEDPRGKAELYDSLEQIRASEDGLRSDLKK